ncbi:Ribosomal RNA methyltransferase (FmrO) [uncultured archaeon]|nr:Ribosomal RNA methyltransferase (FmrO) [uncultured archaeon]
MEKLINEFLIEIKKGKKYSTLSDEIIVEEIKEYLRKNNRVIKIDKQSVKEIRSKLHRLYSSYLRGKKNRRVKLLEELKKSPGNVEIIEKILSTAVSTKERLQYYNEIYKEIFEITGKPKTIIDLGAGINPVSYIYMKEVGINSLSYYSYDIDISDINFLNDYFQIMKTQGLNGKAQILNVRNLEEISNLPSSDIIFMFKLIDLINTNNHKPGEELIKNLSLKTKYIVVSFSTNTISGKPMNLPRRKGFELMLERVNLKFKVLKIPGEVFYVINR